MTFYSHKLYRCLSQHLLRLHRMELLEEQVVEQCFLKSVFYWKRLVDRAYKRPFLNVEAEVIFYKKLKPQFTMEAEYYNLLYHAILFKPLDENGIKNFWLRELKKIDAILRKHTAFFTYCQAGRTDMDRIYFNHASSSLDQFLWEKPAVLSPIHYDLLLSYLLALQRYRQYILAQLNSRVLRAT